MIGRWKRNGSSTPKHHAKPDKKRRQGNYADIRPAECKQQRFAAPVNAFCRDFLNPYVNFHRPCLFAKTLTDAQGRSRKRYPYKLMMTPYEKLKSLPLAVQYLKPAITFQQLDAQANAISDNDFAHRLNQARATLFKTISNRSKTAA